MTNLIPISKKYSSKGDPIHFYFNLEFVRLIEYLESSKNTPRSTYSINDLQLPFLLYKTLHYYESFKEFKRLSVIFWQTKKYVLFFICQRNLKAIGYQIPNDQTLPIKVRFEIFEGIKEDLDKIDLDEILRNIKFEEKILSDLIQRIDDYRIIYDKLFEFNKLYENIKETYLIAKNGGFSHNNYINDLSSNVFNLFNFYNNNYIAYEHYSESKKLYEIAFTATVISNSIIDKSNRKHFFRSSKLDEIHSFHLWLGIFHLTASEIKKIFDDNKIQSIIVTKECFQYFNTVNSNIKSSAEIIKRFSLKNYSELYHRCINNYFYLVVKSNVSDSFKFQVFENIVYSELDLSKFNLSLNLFSKNLKRTSHKTVIYLFTTLLDKSSLSKWDNVETIFLYADKLEQNVLEEILQTNMDVLINKLSDIDELSVLSFFVRFYKYFPKDLKNSIDARIDENLFTKFNKEYFRVVYENHLPPAKNYVEKFIVEMDDYLSGKAVSSNEHNLIITLFDIYRKYKKNKSKIEHLISKSSFLNFLNSLHNRIELEIMDPGWLFYLNEKEIKILLSNPRNRSEIKSIIQNDLEKFSYLIPLL